MGEKIGMFFETLLIFSSEFSFSDIFSGFTLDSCYMLEMDFCLKYGF